jgi:murein DD-endopeptidase MepM/ murein hydrolase activator NlpD
MPGSLAGPVSIGVPNFFIANFRIPPFLLPIYQSAATRYAVPWEVLAAINEIETDYGRNVGASSAGAVGWMQFLPSTWEHYGVDANGDGVADPDNPVDAVFAAARYLRAAGADTDLRKAVFAYNHASWYVDSVLQRARVIGALPGGLVASLTGLTQAHLPVRAPATYAGRHTSIRIFARSGAAVVAVNDGRILDLGTTKLLGRFVRLRDVYGNTYTYARLKYVGPRRAATGKERLFAHRPSRAGGSIRIAKLRPGARVAAGAVLGRIGHTGSHRPPHMLFQIRPAGAPRIDPKPILDGWRLLAAAGERPLGDNHSNGRTRLVSKGALVARVLADPRIHVYDCGRRDIGAGAIDPRVLATLEFLADSGLDPTVSALKCGHSHLTSSGNVSEHSSGSAVDISAVNGIPIAGHQGPGSITETVVQQLLNLQGAIKPHQIISLMQFPRADNTFAMADHADHIHVGWHADHGAVAPRQALSALTATQWLRLIDRLRRIENPTVKVPSPRL